MTSPVLFTELETLTGHAIGLITLNSESTLNSLTLQMVELMLGQLQQWQTDAKVVAVFIEGAGERAFCAGGDVQALHQSSVEQPGGPCDYAESFFTHEYRLDYLIHNYRKPVIAWGHGIVMGGGLGIYAASNHRIATEKTRIAMPEVTIALFPDVGGSYFLNRMPGECGRFLALTAASINSTDSLYAGLTDYFIGQDQKESVLDNLKALPLSGDKTADDVLISECLSSQQQKSMASMPVGTLEEHQSIINKLCAGNEIEVIASRIAELDTDDKWLLRAKSGLAAGSPLAIKWIFKQLALCKDLPLNSVFQHELVLATNIVRHTEFAEGVRALLIDKDQKPQWLYQSLAEVDDETVASFFEAPWPQNPLADLKPWLITE